MLQLRCLDIWEVSRGLLVRACHYVWEVTRRAALGDGLSKMSKLARLDTEGLLAQVWYIHSVATTHLGDRSARVPKKVVKAAISCGEAHECLGSQIASGTSIP